MVIHSLRSFLQRFDCTAIWKQAPKQLGRVFTNQRRRSRPHWPITECLESRFLPSTVMPSHGGPYSVSSGYDLMLDGSASMGEGTLYYDWTVNGIVVGTDSMMTIGWNDLVSGYGVSKGMTANTYPISLRVTDDNGDATVNTTLTVAANIGPFASLSSNPGLSADGKVHIDAMGALLRLDGSTSMDMDLSEILTFSWDVLNDGIVDSTSTTSWISFTWDELVNAYGFSTLGSYPVKLTVSDGYVSDSTTVDVVIDNIAPIAGDDSLTTTHDQKLDLAAPGLLVNDFDQENHPLTISVVDYPEHGYVIINPTTGCFEYYPDEEYVGPDSLTYQLSDGFAVSNLATVNIDVVNAAPIAVNDDLDAASALMLSYFDLAKLLENDSDPDDEHDSLVVDSVDPVSALGASVSVVSGQIVYDPTGVPALQTMSDFDVTNDIIGYALRDPHGQLAFATMNFDVMNNRPPRISEIPDHITLKDKPTAEIRFTASDYPAPGETAVNMVTLSATSSNQAVVPDLGLAISTVAGETRKIIVTPAAGAVGEAIITVTVDDTRGKTKSETFKVTVEAMLRLIGIEVVSGASKLKDGTTIAVNYDAAGTTVANTGVATFRAVLNDASQTDPLPAGFTVTWDDGGSSLTRTVPRQSANKFVLTASDNLGNTFGMYAYVVGVTHSNFNATPGPHSTDNRPDEAPSALGMHIFNPSRGTFGSGMESEWTVSPLSFSNDEGEVFAREGIAFIPHREILTLRYRRTNAGILDPDTGGNYASSSGRDSDAWAADKTPKTDHTPWDGNGHLYFNDQPGFRKESNMPLGTIGAMAYDNFREWFEVKIGTENADTDKFLWHAFRAVERNPTTGIFANSATGTNEILPGNIFWGALPADLSGKMPAFTISTLPNAQANVAYNVQLTGTRAPDHPAAPLKFGWVAGSGSLPAGLTLYENGTISGTTNQTGVFTFTVRLWQTVTDPDYIWAYREFTLTVM